MIGNIVGGLLNKGAVLGDFESIATVTVGSGGATDITFSTIPSTFQHLQLRGITKTGEAVTASNLGIRLNGSSTGYAYHYLVGDGGSAYSGAATSATQGLGGLASGTSASSTIFGAQIFDILDYANTNKTTTVRALAGLDLNGVGGRIEFVSSLWNNTAAVTSVTIRSFGGQNLQQYSHFALYGIKG